MARLTKPDGEYTSAANLRLKAYEDTGLEPEDILSATDMARVACALHELNQYKELGSLDCLRELVERMQDEVKNPHPDDDSSILACPCCGSGEYLENEDGNENRFCGQCGQRVRK